MFNVVSECIWSIYGPALENLQQMMRLPGSGPVEDANRDGLPVQQRGNTAIVPLMGPMMKTTGFLGRFLGLTSTAEVTQAIEAAGADEEVDQVVLLIDSPGGSVAGLSELGDAVARVAADKEVIAQVDSMAASAAYYVAARASKIYSGRMDMVGSIGARMFMLDLSKAFENEGIEPVVIDTGEFKSAGAPGTEITDRQKADFQRVVDGFFADFRDTVMEGRGMTRAQFDAVGDGRMFFAEEAVELGLIDGIQTLSTTIAQIAPQRRGRRTTAARKRIDVLSGLAPSR